LKTPHEYSPTAPQYRPTPPISPIDIQPLFSKSRNLTMKNFLCLLSILLSFLPNPTLTISQSNLVEISVDWNAVEEHYRLARAMGITVEHYSLDFDGERGSRMRKRQSDILSCRSSCGQPVIDDCIKLFDMLSRMPSSGTVCAVEDSATNFSVGKCAIALISNENAPFCVAQPVLNSASTQIFDRCVENDSISNIGGCNEATQAQDNAEICIWDAGATLVTC
jgi:hypothetical protein